MLITLGLQTAVATYPCLYYLTPFKSLGKNMEVSEEDDRCFFHLDEDHQKFSVDMNGDKKKATLCHSTVNYCLVPEDPYFQGRGLGVWTEQAGESFHSHFKESFWKKRSITSLDHPAAMEQLFVWQF